ncbi:GGDEF domain-containing protein [Rhizobium lentis]|uniref:GGDEF domain-containing protein n=1 Tax=Rhizobium lentis TaxID=1138194 RepID=UPI001C83A871|nr:GGDEF domain-containing protein [Rhizobium lentis]MBX4956271.1 GGDEF domain-containing protein [Rhizobium lentis]MBX4985968.1 GGDEF domain-containing protein [Rhizobium lentis]MBX5004412.1 GGDEF domain-containing protein [Rhizobium lentis]MBX5028865.1 GGDEF domain-containing protein [Rhizobium lentis]MBX5034863.1 GGDEF domain-containing protein [Rhizobium lentis]
MQNANALVPREAARSAPMADIQRIAQHMARLNVAALPRNYELFHEAIIGLNPGLAQDIAALGPQPQQAMLDELGLKYRLVGHCGLAGETSRSEASRMLREIAERLAEGLRHKDAFARACGMILKSLSGHEDQSLAAFIGEIDYLSASLTAVLSAEMDIGARLQEDIKALQVLERGISAMQSAAVADKITGLANRIAFNRVISELYEREGGAAGSALIMVDIDNFTDLNERYGTQAGNKLLKKLAGLFSKSIKKNDFVARTEAHEFGFLFSNVGMQDAMAIAERLRTSVEDNLVFATSDKADPGRLTISIGVALSADATTAGQLQANARVALFAAQSNRRQPVQAFGR